MGLDWILTPKARPGFELAYKKLMRERAQLLEFHEGDCWLSRFEGAPYNNYNAARQRLTAEIEQLLRKVSISSYEELGCPRVGADPEATEWLRHRAQWLRAEILRAGSDRFAAPVAELWQRPFQQILAHFDGYFVSDLPKIAGEGLWHHGLTDGEVSFRGNLIRKAEVGLSSDLVEEAFLDHNPSETLEYAARLECVLTGGDNGESGHWNETVASAARWLKFWGERGYGFWASY